MIIIEPADPKNPNVQRLLRESQTMMESLFPSKAGYYLAPNDLTAHNVHLFMARIGDAVVGTGALVVGDGYGELKSIFVDSSARGQGVADAMMRQLEDQARELHLTVLRLETGNSLNAATRLYARHGFEICDSFGDYEETATSLFMHKPL